jgi:HK97 family phage major capsid protein
MDPKEMVEEQFKAMNKTVEDSVKTVKDELGTKLDESSKEIGSRMDDLEGQVKVMNLSVRENVESDPKAGYSDNEEFMVDVMTAGIARANASVSVPEKLLKSQEIIHKQRNTVGSDEQKVSNNPDGGFLVPSFIAPGVLVTEPQAIQNDTGMLTRKIPMATFDVGFNARVDKNHSTSVTGGLRVYRQEEAAAAIASKAQFEQVKLHANKLMGIAYATDEILTASPISFAALIQGSFNEEHVSKLNDERLWGTGAGQYMGVYNAPCKVAVARAGASAIAGNDIVNMKMRCWGYNNAVWIANQDCELQLINAHIALTNTDIIKLYNPDSQTIMGRPVMFDENAQTLGTAGDLGLINFNEYLEGQLGSKKFDESIHVRFVYAETAFRTIAYNDGAPWWRTALTPKNSSNTLSPIVQLSDAS